MTTFRIFAAFVLLLFVMPALGQSQAQVNVPISLPPPWNVGCNDLISSNPADYHFVHDGSYEAMEAVGIYHNCGDTGGHIVHVEAAEMKFGVLHVKGKLILRAGIPKKIYEIAFNGPLTSGKIYAPRYYRGKQIAAEEISFTDAGVFLRTTQAATMRLGNELRLRRWMAPTAAITPWR